MMSHRGSFPSSLSLTFPDWGAVQFIDWRQKSCLGIYVHVPFCPHICPYCNFLKTSIFSRTGILRYFNHCEKQLIEELKNVPSWVDTVTVYFGGGTPGLFAGSYYSSILSLLRSRFYLEEVSIETNPFTTSRHHFQSWRDVGISRVTLGAQSLCDQTLKTLGRRHNSRDIFQNIEWALDAGFKHIQTDLIYGLAPNIRTISVLDEVKMLVAHGATGISTYALTLEEHTRFWGGNLAHEETAIDEFYDIYSCCEANGLLHIETSNFSKFPALHNNIYWHGLPYIGIGTGAHGLTIPDKIHPYGRRYRVGEESLPQHDLGNTKLDFSTDESTHHYFVKIYEPERTLQHFVEEMVFTLLRTPQGIPWSWLNRFVPDGQTRIEAHTTVQKSRDLGLICLDDHGFRLSWKEKLKGDFWALLLNRVLQ